MIRVEGDRVRLRPSWGFVIANFVLGAVILAALVGGGAAMIVRSVDHGSAGYAAGAAGVLVLAVVIVAYGWRVHFWDEAVEATPTELRLWRAGHIQHRIDRDRLGATSFVVGDGVGSTGKHFLKVYDRDVELIEAWPLRFGYDDFATRPFYEASSVPDGQLLRERYLREHPDRRPPAR